MPALDLSRHADLRANQRGVTHEMLHALIAYADIEAPVGKGCTVLRLSRGRLEDRALRSALGTMADRLRSLAIVVAGDGGTVVTVVHDHGKSGGRPYRRGR